MTAWTEIPNTVFEVGKPARAVDMRAMRDNFAAMADGSANAPRIRIGALQRISAGDQIRSRYDAVRSSGSSNDRVYFGFMQSGSIRVSVDLRRVTTYDASVVVVRTRAESSTEIATFETSSTSFVTRTVDVPVLPGDQIVVRVERHEMRNVRFMTDGEDLYPGSYASLEGNTYA